MDDALDRARGRLPVRLDLELEVVWAHERLAEAVHRPDEAHHELVRRLLVEVARATNLLDPALVHEHDLVGDLHRLLLVVRDEDRRHVHLVVQAPQPGPQVLADACVERAERLVEQEHLGLDRKRSRESHALALSARQLRGVVVGPAGDLDEVEQLVHAFADLGPRPLPDLQPEGDVLANGHVLERRVVLEDEADAALLRRLARDVHAVELYGSGLRLLEPGDDAQERRLAAAAGAEQRRQGAGGDLDRSIVERDEVTEPLRDRPGDDGHLVTYPVTLASFGSARSKPGKDAGSPRLVSLGATEDAAWRRLIARQKPQDVPGWVTWSPPWA